MGCSQLNTPVGLTRGKPDTDIPRVRRLGTKALTSGSLQSGVGRVSLTTRAQRADLGTGAFSVASGRECGQIDHFATRLVRGIGGTQS